MRHLRLIAADDEYDTSLGFILKGSPNYEELMADRDGQMIAHDILEHQNGIAAMGTVWDELEALGGVWFCRGQFNDFMRGHPSIHTPHVHLASDITRMFREWVDAPYNGPGSMRTHAHDHDDDFEEIIAIARRDITKEYEDWDDLECIAEYLNLALHRMRTGYNKAKRRFSKDMYHGNRLFREIKDEIAKAVRLIDWSGQEFRLSYGTDEWGSAHAVVTPIYPDDENY